MDFKDILIGEDEIEYFIPSEVLNTIFDVKEYPKVFKSSMAVGKIKLSNRFKSSNIPAESFQDDVLKYLVIMHCLVELYDYAGLDNAKFIANIDSVFETVAKKKTVRIQMLNSTYPKSILDYDFDN